MAEKIATREAYGNALAEFGSDYDFVVLDADLAAATKTGTFKKKFPERFFDCGIAEGNMMCVAAGLAAAGKPVFDVINGEGVTDLAVVVTRYFGGVLLGTGGLVRAYSKSATDALENAKKAEMIPCMVFETVCEYTDHGKLLNLIEAQGGIIEQSSFTDKVVLRYSLRDGDTDPYMKKLSETFSARLKAEEIGRKTVPFEKV